MSKEIIQKMSREQIKALRQFAPKYEALDADERRNMRHVLYEQEGNYAKAFFVMLHRYLELDAQLPKADQS